MKCFRRVIAWVAVAVAVVLVLAVSAAAFLACTHPGLRTLVSLVPGLTVERSEGSLLDFTLGGVRYAFSGVDASLQEASFALDWKRLLSRELSVSHLRLKSAKVRIAASPEAPQEGEVKPSGGQESGRGAAVSCQPASFELPLAVRVGEVLVEDVAVQVEGTAAAVLGRFSASFEGSGSRMRLPALELAGLDLRVPGLNVGLGSFVTGLESEGLKFTVAPSRLERISVEVLDTVPAEPRRQDDSLDLASIESLLAEPLARLIPESVDIPADVVVSSFIAGPLDISVSGGRYVVDEIRLAAGIESGSVSIREFTVRSTEPRTEVSASGGAGLSGDWPVELKAVAGVSGFGSVTGETVSLAVTGSLKKKVNLVFSSSGDAQASLEASASPGEKNLPFSLSLRSQGMQWPFVAALGDGDPVYAVNGLEVTLSGCATAFDFRTVAGIAVSGLPDIAVNVSGTGFLDHASVGNISAEGEFGIVRASGEASWKGVPAFDAVLLLDKFNVEKFAPGVQAEINGRLTAGGTPDDFTASFGGTVSVPGVPVTGVSLDASGSLDSAELSGLTLEGGLGKVLARGRASWKDGLDFDADIDIGRLDITRVVPSAQAVVEGRVRAAGTLEAFAVSLDALVDAALAPKTKVRLEGEGSASGFNLKELTAVGGIGGVAASGRAEWSQGVVFDGGLKLDRVRLAGIVPDFPAVIDGSLAADGSLEAFTVTFEGMVDEPRFPDTAIRISGNGSAEHFVLEKLTVGGNIGTVSAAGRASWKDGLAFDAGLSLERLELAGLVPDFPAVVDGKFAAAGNLEAFSIAFDGSVDAPQSENTMVKLDGEGSATSLNLKTITVDGGIGRIDAAAGASWKDGIVFDIKAELSGIDLAKAVPDVKAVVGGRLDAGGSLDEYRVFWDGTVDVEGVETETVRLSGSGTADSFELSELKFSGGIGAADGSANASWKNGIRAAARIDLDRFDASRLLPGLPLVIGGRIEGEGGTTGSSWDMSVPVVSLSGTLAGSELSVNAEARGGSSGLWQMPSLRVKLGKNIVTGRAEMRSGSVTARADLDMPELAALSVFVPGLSGSLAGTVSASGRLEVPRIVADLNAQKLAVAGASVAELRMRGDVSIAPGQDCGVDISFTDVRAESVRLKTGSVTLKGKDTDHALNIVFDGRPVGGSLSIKGGLDRTKLVWKGEMATGSFETPAGAVELKGKAPLYLDGGRAEVKVGTHCWENAGAEVCLTRNLLAGSEAVSAAVTLKRLDLDVLRSFLPEGVVASGTLSADAGIEWNVAREKIPTVKAKVSGSGLEIGVDESGSGRRVMAFPRLDGNVSVSGTGAAADFSLQQAGGKPVTASVAVTDPLGRKGLSGSFRLPAFDLSELGVFIPEGGNEAIGGTISADLGFSGSLDRPLLAGSVTAENLMSRMSMLPFEMEPSCLKINFAGETSVLAAELITASGNLKIDGSASWKNMKNPRAEVKASGENFRLSLPGYGRVDISPDISVVAAASGVAVKGRVDVPWARISVDQVPEGSVGISGDTVMLDGSLRKIPAEQQAFPVDLDVTVHIGDDVKANAMKLKIAVAGDIRAVQTPKGLTLHGQIELPEGSYHAYGQDLIVQKGVISFAGPADNPILNIEAIRNPDAIEDDVTAGVRVTGYASEPKIEVFATPSMSQEDALSYLLTGQGLGNGETDNMVTGMLVGLAASSTGGILGTVGDAIGIHGLALDTEGVGDSQMVTVSGYIAPGLKVKYGVGLFDSLATLTIRYRLLPKLFLEAVTGTYQAVDLLYSFDF